MRDFRCREKKEREVLYVEGGTLKALHGDRLETRSQNRMIGSHFYIAVLGPSEET